MQRDILSLEPDQTNPAMARVTFADGGSYVLPTDAVKAAYDQQQQARQSEMLAYNNSPTPAAQLSQGAAPMQVGADFFQPQPVAPSAPASPSPFNRESGVAPQAPANATALASGIAPQAPTHVAPPPRAASPAPAQQPAGSQAQPGSSFNPHDLAEIIALKKAGYNWTAQDEAMHALHPNLSRAELLAYRNTGSGTKAISQQDWAKRAQQGTVLPTSTQTSITGKAPIDQSELDKITQAQLNAANANADYLKAASDAKREELRLKAVSDKEAADRLQSDVAKRETAWQNAWNKFQDDNETGNKVDPNRLFKSGGIGAGLAIIGAALERAGSVYAHQSGPTTLDKMLDRDIRAQEADIAARRGRANNQLMILSQQFGSIDAGKVALKISQKQALDSKLGELMATNAAPAEAKRLDAERKQLQASILSDAAKLKALYGGTISETTQGQVMYPQAARAGGPRYSAKGLNAAEHQGREENRKDIEIGIKAGAPDRERAERLGERMAQLAGARDAMTEYFQSIGLQRDPKSGKWVKPPEFDHPLYGPLDSTVLAWSDRSNVARAALRNATEAFGRAQSGAAISTEEREAFDNLVAGGNMRDSDAAANEIERMINDRMKYLGAGAGGAASDIVSRGVIREKQKTFQSNKDDAAVQPYQAGTK